MWLKQRKAVLALLAKLTRNLEKSKSDPEYKLDPLTESVCRSVRLTDVTLSVFLLFNAG